MFYVGLDIHDKRIAICVPGGTGQNVRRAQVRTTDEMMRILEALPDRFEVCYEASCGYGDRGFLMDVGPKRRSMVSSSLFSAGRSAELGR
jgi:hypothetical protein